MDASKLQKKMLVKYINKDVTNAFVHMICRVSSINICICIYFVWLSVVKQ